MRGIHVWTSASALGLAVSLAAPALAQAQGDGGDGDIVVTARRFEERLQDVPISISVVTQEQISDRNITSPAELSAYVPSLSTDQRYGGDSTTFNIRGYYQEASSAPTVGVYFADAVAPRGNSVTNTPSGDGVAAGNMFDLQNVQVLKGPQGTLFGRNTTGGAILLVPQKPTDRLEGYIEGSIGNFDLKRVQAVLNVPLAETVRVRLGVDRQTRDGWQNNISGVGPARFGSSDYWAARLSIIADLTPNLENYTIATYSKSDPVQPLNSLVACNSGPQGFGTPGHLSQALGLCGAYQARRAASNDFYSVQNPLDEPVKQRTTQWQIINTTTWKVSDSLTIKNIVSYAQFESRFRGSIFGENYVIDPATVPATVADVAGVQSAFLADRLRELATKYQGSRFFIAQTSDGPNGPSASQSTFSEELQFQGGSDRFKWQAGGYLEISNPIDTSVSQGVSAGGCINTSYNHQCADVLRDFIAVTAAYGTMAYGIPAGSPGGPLAPTPPAFWNFAFAPTYAGTLANIPGVGKITTSNANLYYRDYGIYAQGTYKFSDQFAVTAGLRWSRDTVRSVSGIYTNGGFPVNGTYSGPTAASQRCNYVTQSLANQCVTTTTTASSAATWLIDLEYTPNPDTLIYAKYTRGYRQGGLQPRSATPSFNPEKIDAFEIGAKHSFRGAGVSGNFNIAGFYNSLKDQQLQASYSLNNTFYQSLLNVGASRVWGVEVDANVRAGIFSLEASAAWLDSKITEAPSPAALQALIAAAVPPGTIVALSTFPVAGEPLPLAPRWRVTLTPSIRLPVPDSWGRIVLSGTMVYTSESYVTSPDGFKGPNSSAANYNEATTLFNANLNWRGIGGTPIDLSVFVTNLTNKRYNAVYLGGWNSVGSETGRQGLPRMFGARLRYTFGR